MGTLTPAPQLANVESLAAAAELTYDATMPFRAMSFYARQYLIQPANFAATLQVPLLVWEMPPDKKDDELIFGTVSGAALPRPSSRDPLVFDLKKGSSKNNAFAFGITVGRTENNDIPLDDKSVSRFHAYFQQDPKSGWQVIDADSRNGTSVNGVKLEGKVPVQVRSGAKLRFGSVEMTLFSPDAFVNFIKLKMGG